MGRISTVPRNWKQDTDLIKSGRGQGEGVNFLPWYLAHQERRDCTTLRCYSPLTGRVHHLFTRKNIQYFYEFLFDETITDIREYYALLPREETISLADRADIRFPRYKESHDKKVLTFDFVVSRGIRQTAVTVLTNNMLNNVQEKRIFRIRQLYCEWRGWDYFPVYKENLNQHRTNNIRMILAPDPFPETIYSESVQRCFMDLYFGTDKSVYQASADTENACGLPKGAGIHLFLYLLRKKKIVLDLSIGPIDFSTKGELTSWKN